MRNWWRGVRPGLLAIPIYYIARLIGTTLRLKTSGFEIIRDLSGGKILAGWHGRTFIATRLLRNLGVWTIISHSRDGEMQNRIFTKFGFRTIRGSSGRGGVRAAVEAIRVLRSGATMAFTPDGPRGPSGIVQEGIMLMAQKSGAALIPVGVSANPRWLVKSWDRYMVPKPFAKAIMIFGDPIFVAANADEDELEQARLRLQREIHRLEAEAEKAVGHPTTTAVHSRPLEATDENGLNP